jgi:CRISPR type III-A-associated protein Csm2
MANQHHNKGGSNSNYGNKQGGSNSRPSKKTTAELANEVINEYFKDLENDLLLLNDITKIKSIFFQLENFIKEVSSGLTASQLRNVYGKVLDAKNLLALQLIRPNLAYVAARNKDIKAKKVMAFIDFLIQKVDEPEKHKSFNKVLETMVAYHKYYYQPKEQEK